MAAYEIEARTPTELTLPEVKHLSVSEDGTIASVVDYGCIVVVSGRECPDDTDFEPVGQISALRHPPK